MQQSDLRPARDYARKYGVKSLVHGAPGSGKTPLLNTAPRPLLLACEPGLLSMRNSNVPTWPAYDDKRVDEFFKWWFGSNEVRNFDTLGVDSASEMATLYLNKEKRANKHGLKAYGEMAEAVYAHLWGLFHQQQKHIYIICKQGKLEGANGGVTLIPGFPGNMLEQQVPHLYDEILHLGIKNVPNVGQVKAFQTCPTIDVMARDRSGMLSEYEPPDLTALFTKAMS